VAVAGLRASRGRGPVEPGEYLSTVKA
jgi:hypothetical protein